MTVLRRLLLVAFFCIPLLRADGEARAFELRDIGNFIRDTLHLPHARRKGPRPLAPRPDDGQAAEPSPRWPVRFRKRAGAPLPRPRPALPARKAREAPPLPRPRPAPPPSPVVTDRSGKVKVSIERLGRERDPMSAVKLAPKEDGAWPPAETRAARRRCEIVLAATNVEASPLPPVGGPSGCGIAAPVMVRALGAVRLKPAAKLNCTMTAAAYRWITDVVQPEARRRFGRPVVAIRQMSSYACRRRGGITKGPVRISEHAFGNALDVGAFTLSDGTVISVLKDWGGLSALFNRKAAFLRAVHEKACGIFSTVLGPEANAAHKNHFHFDLGRGGRYKYCR